MSSYQGASYFNNLMQQANKLKTEQEARNRALISQYETKVRQSNIFERARQAGLSGSSSRNITPRKKPLVEPDLAYTKESVSSIGQLYKEAQAYNPFATKKTEQELKQPLTYFRTLVNEQNKSIGENKLNYSNQLQNLDKQKADIIENINKKYAESNIGSMNYGNMRKRWNTASFYDQMVASATKEIEEQKRNIQNQLNRYNESSGVIGTYTKTLGDLSAELEKYYGKNFENISKEQLIVADLSSFQSLTGDIAKYESLRDSYIKKYQQSGSKVDMDWIKQYNNLLSDTAKSISTELPKIFTSAGKTVESIKQTQQASLSALGQLNKVFGERSQSTLKQQMQERKISDVPTSETRQQIIARQQRLSTFGEQASKPSPKFIQRPT